MVEMVCDNYLRVKDYQVLSNADYNDHSYDFEIQELAL